LPRYDYKCYSCGIEFELTQTFKEAGAGICPDCSGDGRRIYHVVPVIYKGSGFYTTDYGRPKSPADNGKEARDTRDSSESTQESTKESTKASTKESTQASTKSSPTETRSETNGTKSETTSKPTAAATPSSDSKS